MKIIIADVYDFYVHNSKNVRFPREYKNHKIIWNLREALLVLWEGKVTELVIPELGTPGYDFPNFVQDMMEIGQIKSRPEFKYYKFNIVKKGNK
jgi:hypothetical protein